MAQLSIGEFDIPQFLKSEIIGTDGLLNNFCSRLKSKLGINHFVNKTTDLFGNANCRVIFRIFTHEVIKGFEK